MDNSRSDRRQFLQATGMLTGALLAGGALALIAPGRAWALDLNTLSSAEGSALMAVARTLAPHDSLEDAAYALVVKAIDTAAAGNAGNLAMLREGLAQLGAGFAAASEVERVKALAAMEGSGFFKYLRFQTLSNLYASPLAYAHFGYEGEVFSKGGYLLRGFNDLRWLPEVPLADSGPVYTGA